MTNLNKFAGVITECGDWRVKGAEDPSTNTLSVIIESQEHGISLVLQATKEDAWGLMDALRWLKINQDK